MLKYKFCLIASLLWNPLMASDLTWSHGRQGPMEWLLHATEPISCHSPLLVIHKPQPLPFSGIHKTFLTSGLGSCVGIFTNLHISGSVGDSGLCSSVFFSWEAWRSIPYHIALIHLVALIKLLAETLAHSFICLSSVPTTLWEYMFLDNRARWVFITTVFPDSSKITV